MINDRSIEQQQLHQKVTTAFPGPRKALETVIDHIGKKLGPHKNRAKTRGSLAGSSTGTTAAAAKQ